ncbi:nodulation-signaling pathway 2 protein-like isoform X2 [Glycine soja]|uniref:Nodulation-signaling pathway 2 protein n=1 Tax=Glycine soja TaxID=3848 RepID=A0A0B2QT71_GLYSO|nr:nodulation-signaling pathway 2 protein-like isoform X2 [Glycine soja]KHN23038.1 Nodulation-signaling pathway 2 protein [Glycine soja]
MMQSEDLQFQWPFFEDMNSTFDQGVESYGFTTMDDHVGNCEPYGFTMDDHVGDCGLSTLLSTPGDSTSEICSIPFPSSPMFSNDHIHIQYPINEETMDLPSLMELDDFYSILDTQIISIQGHGESEGSFFPSQNLSSEVENAWSPTPSVMSELSTNQTSPLTLPLENMEIEKQVSLPHLLKAYGEALEQGQKALEEVTLRRISQKASPLGESLERFAFYLSQGMTNHGDYLKGEAFKNFGITLRALYQGFPIGKIAHFAAVSTILEAMPQDYDVVHIVDFCIGHGVQWPPMIEAIAHMHKTLKLTTIKWGGEGSECVSSPCNFDETRRQLYEHAKSCGLKLKVEEKGVEELVTEIKKMNKKGGRREFLAFNCMIDLPHMGKVRSRKNALQFLRVAEELINTSGNRGIITFGDGGAFEKVKNNLNFWSFFYGHLVHYQILLESMESHFPTRFSEVRIAMEQLFLQPCISSLDWLQTWEEMKRGDHLEAETSLEGCQLSKNILMEIREVLRESEGSYQAKIEGQHDNELVLEYKGTQLLRFSTWKN